MSLISDPLKAAATIQHPEEMRRAYCPVQSQPGYVELKHIFLRPRNHLQETNTTTSSSKFKQPTPNDGSSTLQNDHPQVERKADVLPSVRKSNAIQQLQKTSPLLFGLLEGNELTLKYLSGFSSLVKKPHTSVGLQRSDNPSVEGQVSQKDAVMVSSSCEQITATTQDPLASHSAHLQPDVLCSSPSAEPSAYKSSAAYLDKLLSHVPLCRTDAEILELIRGRIALFKAHRPRPDHNMPNFTSVPCHSAASPSNGKDATLHRLSFSPTKRSTAAPGQASEADGFKGAQVNAELPPMSDKNGNVSATLKHSNGTTTSSVEVCPNVTVDKCLKAGVELPQQVSYGSKLVCGIQTPSYEKVNNKHIPTCLNMNSVTHYSLSALKDLAATLDNVVTNAEMDVSEVLLEKYWDGEQGNIGVFASKEYPQIMLEVAATCRRNEEESPVLTALSSNSSLRDYFPQEDQASWINIAKNLPGSDPLCEVSSIPKHTAAKDKGITDLKPVETDGIRSLTNSLEHGMNASRNKQKNTKDMQSYKATSKEVNWNSEQNSSMQNISSENVLLTDNEGGEQRLCHSGSHSAGETAENNQKSTSSDEGTFSVMVLKVPHYEDVTDTEDSAQPHKESLFATVFKNISDNINLRTANTAVETPAPSAEGPVPEVKSHGQTESVSQVKLIPEDCCCPYYVETETAFVQVPCPKCDSERLLRVQTEGSQSPSTVLKGKEESDEEMDHWHVIPLDVCDITMSDKCEPDEADLDGERIASSSPVSVSPQSTSTQRQAVQPGHCCPITPAGGMLEMETDTSHSTKHPSCESDNSCDTEDSCDYGPTQGRNYLTVSRQAWKNLPAMAPPEQRDKRARPHHHQRRRHRALTNRDKSNVDSDMEDERGDSWTKMSRKREEPVSSGSVGSSAPSHHHHKRRSSDKDSERHESVVEKSTREQLSRHAEELSVKNSPGDRTEPHLSSETEDSSDYGNYKNDKRSCTSSSGSGRENSGKDEKTPEKARQQFKQHSRSKSLVEQKKEVQTSSSKPPQINKTEQSRKVIDAEAQIGPTLLKTDRKAMSRGSHAAHNAKPKDKTNKKPRRAARIYSDSSESEEELDVVSHGSDVCVHVNKHTNGNRLTKTDHVRQKPNSLLTSDRRKCDDKLEKDCVEGKAETTWISETEDSEDSFSDATDSLTPFKQNRKLMSPKILPNKPPWFTDSTSPPSTNGVLRRLYVQKSRSSEWLKLSKKPVRTVSTDTRPEVTANTSASKTKKTDSSKSPLHGKVVPKPKSSSSSHPAAQPPKHKSGTSGPKQQLPAPRQQLSHSYSHPPTAGHPSPSRENQSSSTSAHSSAWEKVKGIWKDRFFPIPVHKKASYGTENDANLLTEAEPGPSNHFSRIHKRKHSSYKSETPLMKKTKSEAKERTRDINYNPQRRHSRVVAGHYKWKSRREGQETEGSYRQKTRCLSSPELDWD